METSPAADGSQDVDVVIARIRAYMARSHLTRGGIAAKAGLQESSIRYIAQPDWNPTAETLRKLTAVIPPNFLVSTPEVREFAPAPPPPPPPAEGEASQPAEEAGEGDGNTGEAAAS